MQTLRAELENCYGIKKLDKTFDFTNQRAYAIYAPNGVMKSSLAQTFKDVADGVSSKDRVFVDRVSVRNMTLEDGSALAKENVVVILPYDEVLGQTERTSTLLVDSVLREEYEKLHVDIERAKQKFLKALKAKSGSKKNLEKEISLAFTRTDSEFDAALLRVKGEVEAQVDAPFSDLRYDVIFDEKVIELLGTKDYKSAIANYVTKYDELLDASTYFKRGVFNYYNASTIAKNLADNGFFAAKHSISLNAKDKLEITSEKELEAVIQKEKDGITDDAELKKKFAELGKLIERNVTMRDFDGYISEHADILPELVNIEAFKEKVWKSYFRANLELYKELIELHQAAKQRKQEIEQEAHKQRTQWEEVIQIFNNRFFVPFTLTPKNKVSVILGQEPILILGFVFQEGDEKASVERDELLKVLSTGEKKALYVLNIIFEIEARKKAGLKTIFVVDDIADSFDYKNKYAIIQYLKDISDEPNFYQLILTHNFDFFRTVESRFVNYKHCLMAVKNSEGIVLSPAAGVKNVFVNDWKLNFFIDKKKKVASIPFMRNLIEYTKGVQDADYAKLTSLLHWKADSAAITQGDLDGRYNALFNAQGASAAPAQPMIEVIYEAANECLNAAEAVNFENKIVLSIAIRLKAEEFMVRKIANPAAVDAIDSKQTTRLLRMLKDLPGIEADAIDAINQVVLMTPENIHLNSFMYEPILDMSDEHLRRLYQRVLALQ